jgi:yecA family protein
MARKERVVAHAIRPPNIATMDPISFIDKDHEELTQWLAEPGWPRGTMGISTLEGYLTALIAWPFSLSSGAWLPRVWNDGGWRIPPIIDDAVSFERFLILITGYMQSLDRAISADPPSFTPTLLAESRIAGRRVAPEVAWSAGFRAAMEMGAFGALWISPAVRSAVDMIARQTMRPAGGVSGQAGRELAQSVLVLAGARSSRGPLGALPLRPRCEGPRHRDIGGFNSAVPLSRTPIATPLMAKA